TAAATAATAATAEAATTSGLAFARFVDGERAPVERLAVQLGDRRLRILVAAELDEREPARLPRHAIGHDADADDFAPTGGAGLTKRSFVRVIREISDVNASTHSSLPSLFLRRLAASSPGNVRYRAPECRLRCRKPWLKATPRGAITPPALRVYRRVCLAPHSDVGPIRSPLRSRALRFRVLAW